MTFPGSETKMLRRYLIYIIHEAISVSNFESIIMIPFHKITVFRIN